MTPPFYLKNVRDQIQLIVSSYLTLLSFTAQTARGATGGRNSNINTITIIYKPFTIICTITTTIAYNVFTIYHHH